MKYRIGHLAYHTKDMEKSLKFYTEVLGFHHIFGIPDNKGNKWIEYIMGPDGRFIELFYPNENETIIEGGTYMHLCLEVEPLNILVDHKGYYLDRSDEGFTIIDEVGSPNVKLLFDVYHQQITEGNLIQNITEHIDSIAHIHIAGNPGRHEPLRDSEVHYPTILKALKEAGYQGYIGLEYFPVLDPDQGLKEIKENMPI